MKDQAGLEYVFEDWPKIPRLNREMIITEKIDGTNAQILIPDVGPIVTDSGRELPFLVGSRTRWIFPENDNYGFARWAYEHQDALRGLGPGRHFGEWWGAGIQRGYGLREKRFSLFNTPRWEGKELPLGVGLVPVLYKGPFDSAQVKLSLGQLAVEGSKAAPGFMKPEGIVVFHVAAQMAFKITIEGDEKPKGSKE